MILIYLKKKKNSYPYLGVFVVEVEENSNAEQQGLFVGDQIVRVNNISIRSMNDLQAKKKK